MAVNHGGDISEVYSTTLFFQANNLYIPSFPCWVMNLESEMAKGNRSRRIFNSVASLGLSALLAITSATFTGCEKTKPGQAPGISEELQDEWPLWKSEDLEINRQKGGVLLQYTHTMYVRPEFYRDKMPLEFISQEKAAGAMMGMHQYVGYNFGDFSDYFIYDSGVFLKGAVAVDNSNALVAEARISYQPSNTGLAQMRMEEFHYSKGLLVFHCISEVDNSLGTKTRELEKSGKKKRDYFFLLPGL